MKLVWQALVAAVIVTIMGAGVYLTLSRSSAFFSVQEIPVDISRDAHEKGLDDRAESRLKERLLSKLSPFLGKKIWDAHLAEMQAAILADEWVHDVRILRSFPNVIRASVRVKVPELLLLTSDAHLRPIADDGSLLNVISPNVLPNVPIIRGAMLDKDLELRQASVQLVESLPMRGPLSSTNITEIVYSAADGYSILLANSRSEVRLGHDQFKLKAARANQVLEYLIANKLKGRVIDASFSKKVLVRLRKGS